MCTAQCGSMDAKALSFVLRAASSEHYKSSTRRVFTYVVGGRVGMNDTCYFTLDMTLVGRFVLAADSASQPLRRNQPASQTATAAESASQPPCCGGQPATAAESASHPGGISQPATAAESASQPRPASETATAAESASQPPRRNQPASHRGGISQPASNCGGIREPATAAESASRPESASQPPRCGGD